MKSACFIKENCEEKRASLIGLSPNYSESHHGDGNRDDILTTMLLNYPIKSIIQDFV